jgi:hypothetical protein
MTVETARRLQLAADRYRDAAPPVQAGTRRL